MRRRRRCPVNMAEKIKTARQDTILSIHPNTTPAAIVPTRELVEMMLQTCPYRRGGNQAPTILVIAGQPPALKNCPRKLSTPIKRNDEQNANPRFAAAVSANAIRNMPASADDVGADSGDQLAGDRTGRMQLINCPNDSLSKSSRRILNHRCAGSDQRIATQHECRVADVHRQQDRPLLTSMRRCSGHQIGLVVGCSQFCKVSRPNECSHWALVWQSQFCTR